MIDWSQTNEFWSGNVLSAAKLRKQYDTMAVQANQESKASRYHKPNARKEVGTDWSKVKAPVENPIPKEDFQERLKRIRDTHKKGAASD
ncbi:hypothetical protein [Companilactobacillus halodurans]|uniref:hypothetical protein n=1 Tax=Companilactobacillus halodurans TaxID=2584183 RepID=UPI00186516E2|nr:hypothetical protein [Companilactobacillus halodurans]